MNDRDLQHTPVLLVEAVRSIAPRAGGIYIDATYGGGGHTAALLEASNPDGRVLALDADAEAIERAALHPEFGARLVAIQTNFRDLAWAANSAGFSAVDGVLFDLGLSSYQLGAPGRGFALRLSGPLDMRFDPASGVPVESLVNELTEAEMAELFWRFGEEPASRRVAAAIVRERQRTPITTTDQLAALTRTAIGGKRGANPNAPAQVFQALRIAVNDELEALPAALTVAIDLLKPGGRLAVISFHSLEDRIVKHFIARESRTCVCPPEQPICTCDTDPRLRAIGKPVRPTAEESALNPRSRSAILRTAERTGGAITAAAV